MFEKIVTILKKKTRLITQKMHKKALRVKKVIKVDLFYESKKE